MATPNWRKASRARSKRLGARCLTPSLVFSPERRDGCAKVRRYYRKARGSGRCMKEGLILSLLRATAEGTVARGLPPLPAFSPLLTICYFPLGVVGGCPTPGNGRKLKCGCFPVGDQKN